MLSLLALASSAVWGTSDFIAGVTTRRLPAAAVVGWSQAVGLLAMTLVVLLVPWEGAGGWAAWAALAGVAGSTGLVAFYAALASGTMGVVAPVASLGVVVPVALGVLGGETPSSLTWAGIGLAVAGIVLASGPELSGAVSARPLALAGVAAVGFGMALYALDRGSRVSIEHTLWGMRLTTVCLFVVAALVLRTAGPVTRGDAPVLVVIGLADLGANALFAVASSGGYVSVASVLGSLYPVVTVLLARLLLKERLRRIQQAGVVLALVGVVMIAV